MNVPEVCKCVCDVIYATQVPGFKLHGLHTGLNGEGEAARRPEGKGEALNPKSNVTSPRPKAAWL